MRQRLAWAILTLLCAVGPLAAQSPDGPGQILYVDCQDEQRVRQAWQTCVRQNKAPKGPAVASPPSNGWIALGVLPLERLEPEVAAEAARALSAELGATVLHLAVSADQRAWYFYANQGKWLDRYCSNPGLPTEVSPEVLRRWAGRPDLLLPICRGKPLSATRSEVSLTDLNALLYYYYPEMKLKKPAAWRSSSDLMRLLGQVLGTPQPPAPFASLVALPGWKRL